MKKLHLFFIIIINGLYIQANYAQWNQIGPTWEGTVLNGIFAFEIAMNKDGTIMAVSDPARFQSYEPNPVRIFERQEDNTWNETGLIFNDMGVTSLDLFGGSMDISADGSILAVGIPTTVAQGNQGRVEIYQNVNGTWTQIGEDIENPSTGPAFGGAVTLSADGSTVAISSSFDVNNNRIGFAQVYKNINGSWEQIGQTLGLDSDDRRFGSSLSFSDDASTLLVGISDPFTGFGRLEIYRNVNDNWVQVGDDIVGLAVDSQFGSNTAISADGNIVVGAAFSANFSSTAYIMVFENVNDNWVQLGSTLMNAPNALANQFGKGLAISDDGSLLFTGDENLSGRLEIFSFENGDWNSIQVVEGDDSSIGFADAIAINSDGSALAVGQSNYADDNLYFRGALRFYLNQELVSTENVEGLNQNITTYPNPVSELLNIVISDAVNEVDAIDATISDIHGRQLKQFKITDSNTALNLKTLPPGAYTISFQNQDKTLYTTKIIKE